MSREDATQVVATWGQCRPFRRSTESNEGLAVQRVATTVFVYCDDSGCVEAIEFSSPGHGVESEDQIVFEEIDLFVDMANAVLDRLRKVGLHVVDHENGISSTAHDVLLALWRDGEPIDDATGLPAYFESALIARPGYYD